jgi:HAD superfamily hydrolase (TIGR01459 family)
VAASPDFVANGQDAFGGIAPAYRLSELAIAYDAFILDQWGVLHDGTQPYPGTIDCLKKLHATGKPIAVLSNSSKRETENLELMATMGFDPASLIRFVSAGEEARLALTARADAFHAALGRRCYTFTRGGDRSLVDGIGLEFVERVQDAEFLVVIGSDSPRRNLASYEAELQAGIARQLPMVCANPDLARITPNGLIEAQGLLARRYESLGGTVFYHGKPHPPIYRACLQALGGLAPARVLAIGDSIEHDILGAARAGIRSALIPGGVHASALDVTWGALPLPGPWNMFINDAPAKPDHLLAAFNW